jgi:two-component system, OmpR family, catabolic regulation response regulator CreB
MGPAILLLEDEPAIADTLVYALKTEGFSVEWCLTGRAGREAFAAGAFALIILDVGLPDGNGFDWCRELRRTSQVPVLFLTARNAEVDRIVGLEIGGDDYVTKPFSPREVAARVRAILRRGVSVGTTASTEVPVEDFTHDVERCAISFRGVRLELSRYEYRLLATLLARPGRVFSRDDLMARVWEDPGASLDRTVDAHIKMVRAKVRQVAGVDLKEDPIQTHRGLGYSLRPGRNS